MNEILAPELGAHGIFASAHSITTGRRRGRTFRGGWLRYEQLRSDLVLWMKQDRDPNARFSTMVDLHRLPIDFPGRSACLSLATSTERVACLERELSRDVAEVAGTDVVRGRFVPYVQLHEFEALLFSDPRKLTAAFPGCDDAVERLARIRAAFANPEEIDGGDSTAPSKRIIREIPDYKFSKPASAAIVARAIGFATMRSECPHFADWVGRLENCAVA